MSIILLKPVRDFSRVPQSHRKVRFTKDEVAAFNAHGLTCHYCGSPHALTADHLIPKSLGGTDVADNLVPACVTCNTSRRHRPYDEFLDIIEAEKAAYVAMFCCGDTQ